MTIARRYTALAAILLLAGCGTSFQGIKIRMQSPPIDEAFRKASLAVSTDGYETESIDITQHILLTKWRGLKPDEMAKTPSLPGARQTEFRLSLRMEQRGKLYDALLIPSVRYTMQDGAIKEETADPMHPLRKKWNGVLRQLMENEQKDED